MHLIRNLEEGRGDFLEAVSEVDAKRAFSPPPDGGWSVVECIEHVVIVESRYLELIKNGAQVEPKRDAENETRLFSVMRTTLDKVETPDPLKPSGQFETLEGAVVAFKEVRARSIETVRELEQQLYAVGIEHPYFGPVNGAEMVQMIDGHSRRHADQIRETWDTIMTMITL